MKESLTASGGDSRVDMSRAFFGSMAVDEVVVPDMIVSMDDEGCGVKEVNGLVNGFDGTESSETKGVEGNRLEDVGLSAIEAFAPPGARCWSSSFGSRENRI